MPIYGYHCRSCGHEFQTLVRSDEQPACPSCGAVELERQLSLIATPARGGEDAAPACSNAGAGPGCGQCPGAAMFG